MFHLKTNDMDGGDNTAWAPIIRKFVKQRI